MFRERERPVCASRVGRRGSRRGRERLLGRLHTQQRAQRGALSHNLEVMT